MKPIYIKMKAFGSYTNELIEFDKVDNGLFLITGDTGAGKTTIFDAITFALYGKTSGGKREGAMMRSQYAPESIKTEVEFKFLYNEEEYVVIRSPKQPNYKKVKDGERYEKLKKPISEKVELIMPDNTTYMGKKEEIDNKIKDIIGLTAEQFTQIAMLAQGDFMKLLHASSEDRKAIFSQIFDTKIYAYIQKELWGRSKAIAGQFEDNKKDIIRELERVQCIDNSVYAQVWEERKREGFFKNNMEDSPLKVVFDITQEAKKQQIRTRADKEQKEKELSDLDLKIRQADSINRLFQEMERFELELGKLKEKKNEMEEIKKKTERGTDALLVEKDYTDFIKKEKALSDCEDRLRMLQKWMEDNKPNLEKLRKKLEKAKAECDNETPLIHTEIEKLKESMEKFEEMKRIENSLKKSEKEISDLERAQKKLVEEQCSLEEQLKRLMEETEILRKNIGNVEVMIKDAEMLENRKKNLEVILKAAKDLEAVQRQLAEKKEELEKAQEEEQKAEQKYDELYHAFIHSQVEVLRAKLEEGKPCPVCGSIHYDLQSLPYESHKITVSENDVENAKKKLKKAKNAKEAVFKQLQEKHSKKEGIILSLNNGCQELLGANYEKKDLVMKEYTKVVKKVTELLQEKEIAEKNYLIIQKNDYQIEEWNGRLGKMIESINKKSDTLNCLKIEQKGIDTKFFEIKKQLPYESKEQMLEQLEEKQKALCGFKEALERCNENYQNLFNEMNTKTGEHLTEKKNLKIRTDEFSKAKDNYASSLKVHGFADAESFREAFMTKEEIERFQNKMEQYNTQLAVTKDNIKRLQKEMVDKEPVEMEELKQKKQQLETMKKQWEQEYEKIVHLVFVNEESYRNSKKLYREREELNKKASIIYNVHNTANGQYSGKMIDFQTYIQRRYFKQIIDHANKRLYKMSNNQFILQCRELKDLGHRGYVGLDIDVYSIVNDQNRDVKTLSGGESFVAALAMALGMADMIQNSTGKVHIDTMFIDEGFGSLSDETRNQAIAILNELSGGKRLVGIISHVTELKAQVETKLVVKKTDSGSTAEWEQ